MTWKAFAGALVALVVGFSPLPAQPSATAGDDGTVAVVASGTGVLAGDGAETSLPWIETAGGPLVALVPLAARLGGELTAGAFGSSYELALGDAVFVVAADSPAVTRGTEILPLSQPPRVYLGAFFVPLDLVPRTWGAVAGVQASWDAGARRLNVHRPSERALAVDISVVHLQGVSTVVLRFPDTPRVRIEPHSDGFDVVAIGDRFVAPPERALDDPFVRAVTVGGDRIRLYLAPGIDAEHYRLGSPDRIVFDLYRTQGAAVAPPARAPAERPGIRTVVIDPGHGGAETGATGPAGTMEKELTLLIARALAERLTTELGLRAVLTRGEDFDLDLDARSALANQNQADLFVSVHLNSAAHGDAHGAETYFLSLAASDQRASEVAALENVGAADGAGEFELRMMLWDLAQSRHLAASQRLATVIQEELNRQLELRDRGVKQAPFRVLMGAAMPAVLVELGFLSSAAEERRLRDPAYRAELVGTLVRAIARFRAEYEASLAAAGAAR